LGKSPAFTTLSWQVCSGTGSHVKLAGHAFQFHASAPLSGVISELQSKDYPGIYQIRNSPFIDPRQLSTPAAAGLSFKEFTS
jgi:hypothetical protein